MCHFWTWWRIEAHVICLSVLFRLPYAHLRRCHPRSRTGALGYPRNRLCSSEPAASLRPRRKRCLGISTLRPFMCLTVCWL